MCFWALSNVKRTKPFVSTEVNQGRMPGVPGHQLRSRIPVHLYRTVNSDQTGRPAISSPAS